MRILVTGADGFLGRYLSAVLASSGKTLTLAVRKNIGQIKIRGDLRVVSVGDIGPQTDWSEALKDVSCVINLAGRAHLLEKDASDSKQVFMEVNCYGVEALFQAAKNAGVAHFLHMSSIHVLGTQTKDDMPFNEASALIPSNDYAVSKLEGDKALLRLAHEKPGSLIILRPPLIVGAGAKGNLKKLQQWMANPIALPLAGLHNRRTLLSIENLVSAIVAVLAHWEREPHSGIYLLGNTGVVSTSDILYAIKRGGKGRAWLFQVPKGVLAIALRMIGGQKLVTQLMGNLEIDSNLFQKKFDWQPSTKTSDSLEKMGKEFARF